MALGSIIESKGPFKKFRRSKNMIVSTREKEVLHLIAHEYTTKEIAQELYISQHTAISHRQNLLSKLEARNTAGLVRRGFELGLIGLQASLR